MSLMAIMRMYTSIRGGVAFQSISNYQIYITLISQRFVCFINRNQNSSYSIQLSDII